MVINSNVKLLFPQLKHLKNEDKIKCIDKNTHSDNTVVKILKSVTNSPQSVSYDIYEYFLPARSKILLINFQNLQLFRSTGV